MAGHNPYCDIRDSGGDYLPEKHVLIYGSNIAALQKRIPQQPITVLVEEPDDYLRVLRGIRAGDYPRGTIAVFDRSKTPDRFIRRLEEKIENVHLLYNVPENLAEAVNIHGDNGLNSRIISQADLNDYMPNFLSAASDLKKLGGKKIEGASGTAADLWLDDYIKSLNKTDFVIVVSHVVRTARLEPEKMEISEDCMAPLIDKSSYAVSNNSKYKPLVWTVGCNTWDYLSNLSDLNSPQLSINRSVTYPQSVAIVKKLLSSKTSPRSMVEAVETSAFPLDVRRRPVILRSGPVPHSPTERPAPPLSLVVENVSDNNIVSDEMIG